MTQYHSRSQPPASIARAACLLAVLALCGAGGPARADDLPSPNGAKPAAVGTRRALIICGLPGDDEHRKLFSQTVEKLHKALIQALRVRPRPTCWCGSEWRSSPATVRRPAVARTLESRRDSGRRR